MSTIVEKLIAAREGRICSDDSSFLRQCVRETEEFVAIIKEVRILLWIDSRIHFQIHEGNWYLMLFFFRKVGIRIMTSTMLQCVQGPLIQALFHLLIHQQHYKKEQIDIALLVILWVVSYQRRLIMFFFMCVSTRDMISREVDSIMNCANMELQQFLPFLSNRILDWVLVGKWDVDKLKVQRISLFIWRISHQCFSLWAIMWDQSIGLSSRPRFWRRPSFLVMIRLSF